MNEPVKVICTEMTPKEMEEFKAKLDQALKDPKYSRCFPAAYLEFVPLTPPEKGNIVLPWE